MVEVRVARGDLLELLESVGGRVGDDAGKRMLGEEVPHDAGDLSDDARLQSRQDEQGSTSSGGRIGERWRC